MTCPTVLVALPDFLLTTPAILVKANTSNELQYSLNYELEKINDWIVANKLT